MFDFAFVNWITQFGFVYQLVFFYKVTTTNSAMEHKSNSMMMKYIIVIKEVSHITIVSYDQSSHIYV